MPLTINSVGPDVASLHGDLDRLGLSVPQFETDKQVFGVGTRGALLALQRSYGLPATGDLDDATKSVIAGAAALAETGSCRIEGRIARPDGSPAAGIVLRLYRLVVGGDPTLVDKTQSDAQGFYVLSWSGDLKGGTLEIRLVDAAGAETLLASVAPQVYTAINLLAPAAPSLDAGEYKALRDTLAAEVGDGAKLAAMQESGDRHDVSLLHEKTGWDARLIALAASAERISATTGIPSEAAYALVRVGLPSNPGALASVSAAAVGLALEKAQTSGIVKLDNAALEKSKQAFSTFALEQLTSAKGAGQLAAPKDFLASAGIQEAEGKALGELYFVEGVRGKQLWEKARANGVSEAAISKLQTQGKLAYLTGNNAALANSLVGTVEAPDKVSNLVHSGFYKPEVWKQQLRDLAAGDDAALEKIVPAGAGAKLDERLQAYSEELARKVRLSFPTQSVSAMVANDELRVGAEHDAIKQPLTTALNRAAEGQFDIRRQSVSKLIRQRKGELFAGVDEAIAPKVEQGMRTLQRTLQLSPNDESARILLEEGFDSAAPILSFGREAFIDRMAPRLPHEVSHIIYEKAEQVRAVTYNLFVGIQELQNSPIAATQIAALPAGADLPDESALKTYPTLETLFGSLDYADCEHCHSVLSPAAYLVDILRFLDPDKGPWDQFLASWLGRHGEAYTARYKRPFDALMDRRPDIAHLPLTCENTETELPYIDVVNEILEFATANPAITAAAMRDTGDAASADLLAEPQNIIAAAYDTLARTRYPTLLPFELWLENVRAFFDNAQTPFWRALEILRVGDDLWPTDTTTYGYVRIFAERLGIGPGEWAVLTAPRPLDDWHLLYGFADAASARAGLASAKEIARRLDVSYAELADVLRTRFVNPAIERLEFLTEIGIAPADIARLKGAPGFPPLSPEELAEVDAKITALDKAYDIPNFDARASIDRVWNAGLFAALLVLDGPPNSDFSATRLKFLVGAAADDLALAKLALFVRLRRRLRWSVGDLDLALKVLIPSTLMPLTSETLGRAMTAVIPFLSHAEALAELLSLRKDRAALFSLWADIDTRGAKPLYRRLFLDRGILQADALFDHPLGDYLTAIDPATGEPRPYHWDGGAEESQEAGRLSLARHLGAVQNGLRLSASEIAAILVHSGTSLDAAPLNLATLSLLHRHALLARALRVSVDDLLALIRLSGLDPFAALPTKEPAEIGEDVLFSNTLRFVEIARTLKEKKIRIDDLDWLIAHRADPLGQYRDDTARALGLFRGLGAEIPRIRAENLIPRDDYLALTDDRIAAKLGLILPPKAVEDFLSVWTGRSAFAVLPEAERATLISQFSAFLTAAEVESALTPAAADISDDDRRTWEINRRKLIADRLLPYIEFQQIQHHTLEAILADTGADRGLIESLLLGTTLASVPDGAPLISGFFLAGERGLTVTYRADPGGAGDPLGNPATVAWASTEGRPAGAASAIIEGYLELRDPGAYAFSVLLDNQGSTAALFVGPRDEPAFRVTAPAAAWTAPASSVELKQNTLYRIRLEVGSLGAGNATLLVSGPKLPAGEVDGITLYPQSAGSRVTESAFLLWKVLRLAEILDIGEAEITYLGSHPSDFDGLDLRRLPVTEAAAAAVDAPKTLSGILSLLTYRGLRRELSGDSLDLLSLMDASHRRYPADSDAAASRSAAFEDVCGRLATLTRRRPDVVRSAATALGYGAESSAVDGVLNVDVRGIAIPARLARLWELLQLVEKLRAPVDRTVEWVRSEPSFAIARDVRNTLKALYDPAAWRAGIKPVFDVLRQKRRDALVAHLMHRDKFDAVEKLFEKYLIDPGMEPVVTTSRIQLAIASVQTFIQRCLLNLEQEVHPSAINAARWEAMKRYRVWEANRKIFLFPENWLEPEFRDEKSHLFAELEGTLLESDVSDEIVEGAFLKYLNGLEEIARLDIVSAWSEAEPTNDSRGRIHVLGRTAADPHKYFYRSGAARGWSPWVPLGIEIEGDHATIVTWRGRVHVFWVTFLTEAEGGQADAPLETLAKSTTRTLARRQLKIRLNWCRFFQGNWEGPWSAAPFDATPPTADFDFNPRNVAIYSTKEYADGVERAVQVNLRGVRRVRLELVQFGLFGVMKREVKESTVEFLNRGFRFTSPHSPPRPVSAAPRPGVPYGEDGATAGRHERTGGLTAAYTSEIVLKDNEPPVSKPGTKDILLKGGSYSIVTSGDPYAPPTTEIGALIAPFFYQDDANTFFVEPTLEEGPPIDKWEHWIIPLVDPDPFWEDPNWWKKFPVYEKPPIVKPKIPFDPGPGLVHPPIDFRPEVNPDWLDDETTLVAFDDRAIGPKTSFGVLAGAGLAGGNSGSVVLVAPTERPDLAGGLRVQPTGTDTLVVHPTDMGTAGWLGPIATQPVEEPGVQAGGLGASGRIREGIGVRSGTLVGGNGLSADLLRSVGLRTDRSGGFGRGGFNP